MILKYRSVVNLSRMRRKKPVIQVCLIAGLILLMGIVGQPGSGLSDPMSESSVVLDKLSLGINLTSVMKLIDKDPSARIAKYVETESGTEILFKVDWLQYSDLNAFMVFSLSNRLEGLFVVLPKREHRCLAMPDFTADVRKLEAAIEKRYGGYSSINSSPLWDPGNPESSLSCHELPQKGLKDFLLWTLEGSHAEKIAIGGMAWNEGPSSRILFSAYLRITTAGEIRDDAYVADNLMDSSFHQVLDRRNRTR